VPSSATARPERLSLCKVSMMGPGGSTEQVGAKGKTLPFTTEMRNAAMALHTFSQAPKEGKVKDQSANTQVEQWSASKEDYMQFLVDSKVVYAAFEEVCNSNDDLLLFRNTGLERTEPLDKDVAFITQQYGIAAPQPSTAATEYASFIKTLPTATFITHFYNYYFAHTAGGMRIGQMVMDGQFGGHTFNFYKWDGDVKEILQTVRGSIDKTADKWSRKEKDASLAETPATFNKSGALLRVLVGKAKDRAARIGFDNKVTVTGGKITAVPVSPYTANKQAWDV
jgi:heme oxygenase